MRSENYMKNIGKVLAIARHANNMTRANAHIASGVSLIYIEIGFFLQLYKFI